MVGHVLWIAAVAAIAWLGIARTRDGVPAGLSTWARLCFPCWKFFDVPGPVTKLWVRELGADGPRPWVEAAVGGSRHIGASVTSPTNALRWARLGLLDQLLEAADRHTTDPSRFRHAPAYRQVCAWAASRVPPGASFEFKIIACAAGRSETLLRSTVPGSDPWS